MLCRIIFYRAFLLKLLKKEMKIFYENARNLYDILIGESYDFKEKDLIVIPDEELNLIPFEVLVSNDHQINNDKSAYHKLKYLIQDVNISYLYSSHLLDKVKEKPKKDDREIFIGVAPKFENNRISNLESNISEIENAYSFYNESGKILLGRNAKLNYFLNEVKNYKIAHLATHAIYNDRIPLDSRIEFADTSLHIYQLYAMEHNLDLAILSACETATGKQNKGEGVISLSRAFIQSGCSKVIASLWSISDKKTSVLMNDFYKDFSKGIPSHQALSNAKRKYLEEAMTQYTHPYYWASIIQIGAEENKSNKLPQFYYLILLLSIVIAVFIFLK